ncbi:MAG: group 1 truncated hemoglobin [Myxococcales bacterium]|nr:MAG: group 1 truncated hemoglobin [Myxococcales bacterium]
MRAQAFLIGIAAALLALTGCGGGGQENVCEPGAQQGCDCGGGQTGAQLCRQDGSGWEACQCLCWPNCGERVCGPDPLCGQSCGACAGGERCTAQGKCEAQPDGDAEADGDVSDGEESDGEASDGDATDDDGPDGDDELDDLDGTDDDIETDGDDEMEIDTRELFPEDEFFECDSADCGTGDLSCEGDALSRCGRDEHGCMRWTVIENCAGQGGVCVGWGDAPHCEYPLFVELGGEAGIRALIAEFTNQAVEDERIGWLFAHADVPTMNNLLYSWICHAAGGGCTYFGSPLGPAHEQMAITNAMFDAYLEDLAAAMDRRGIAHSESFDADLPGDELMAIFEAARADVVSDPDGALVYFNRLGGMPAIRDLVAEWLILMVTDARLDEFFLDADLDRKNEQMVNQFCALTDGFCVYEGGSMFDAHAGLCLADAHYDAALEDLVSAMDGVGIATSPGFDGSAVGDPLVVMIEGFRAEIVQDCP